MNETILIVDDDKDIGEMLMNYFSKEGYTIKYACNGKEGLDIFKASSNILNFIRYNDARNGRLHYAKKAPALSNIINVKYIEINPEECTVTKAGKELALTVKEYEILYTLASNKGRLYSTQMLYELLWKEPFIENDNTVTMHMKNLRDKLGDSVKNSRYIKTVWGMGYKIENDT